MVIIHKGEVYAYCYLCDKVLVDKNTVKHSFNQREYEDRILYYCYPNCEENI